MTHATGESPPLQPVTLVAPAPLAELLTRHLELPDELGDRLARAGFLQRARQQTIDLLSTEGYFAPALRLEEDVNVGPLRLVVEPGPITRVVAVSLVLQGAIAEGPVERRQALQAGWTLMVGNVFRSADWEAAKTALLAAVTEHDYALAWIVDSRAEIDPDTAEARLVVTIDSGPACRFGQIAVDGLRRYDEALVRRHASFNAGDPWRREALLGFQARLQNTPWFRSVVIDTLPPQDGMLPVHVAISEAPARRLGFGVGYGTNAGARGEVNLRHHDLFGRAWDMDSGLRLEQKRQTLFTDLSLLPYRGYRPSFGVKLEHSDIEGLSTRRQVFGARRSRTLGLIETRLGGEWQREERRPAGAAGETDRALVFDWRWIQRAVDDTLDPRKGHVVDVSLGGASRQLLSDRDFLRSQARFQQWWSLTRHDVLSMRAEVGLTAAMSRFGIPQDYLFRTGGAHSVRGYAYQSLGVREGQAIVGGRAVLVGSVEYTRWLEGPWGLAAFVDAGDAADDWAGLDPAIGRGLGLRWKSPAGPLALDVAHGQRSGDWHLHFTLAVAF